MTRKLLLLPAIVAFAGLVSCSDDDESTSAFDSKVSEAVANYSEIVLANYKDALSDAQALKSAVDALVETPSEASLEVAKEAWLDARETYGQTEAFRFYGGPIDGEDGPEGQLNAWPLDESYIDYVANDANGGDDNSAANIINSAADYPEITKEVIASLNEVGSETNVASGYHAVEFLLWGQDVSTGAGGGERPYTDYVTDGTGTNENQDRRGAYLAEATQLIVDDLASLVAEWEADGAYRTSFEAAPGVALENIISALGKLSKGELAGERIFVAWDNRSKEDEHSCFSDNTHRDIVTNALGIQNVYLGQYKQVNGTTVSGVSFYDVLALKDADLAESISTTLAASISYAEAIQPPFDQEILNEDGRLRVQNTFQSLRAQGDLFAEAASEFGFEFDPEDI